MTAKMVELKVNQQPFVISANSTIAALLTQWSGVPLADLKVAVALNQQVLAKVHWQTQQLQAQDEVLIFNLVAGG
jgi:thiamine biosynthesis protein ThiS